MGLSLKEIAFLFIIPNGLMQLDEFVSVKQRQLDIISLVITKFYEEQETLDGISPRDVFLLSRSTDLSPTLEELMNAFEILSGTEIEVLKAVDSSSFSENKRFRLDEVKKTVNRLQALANAIEKGSYY